MVCVTPFRGWFEGVCTRVGSTYVWEWAPRALRSLMKTKSTTLQNISTKQTPQIALSLHMRRRPTTVFHSSILSSSANRMARLNCWFTEEALILTSLNFGSHHPIHHKLGVVHTLLDRMNNVVMEASQENKQEKGQQQVIQGYVTIPYVEGLSKPATPILRKHDIATVMSPHTMLCKLLVYPKDKWDPLSTTGCVYEVPCN